MKSHTYWASALLVLALALWCTLGVSAEDTTTTASGTAGSFQQIVAEVALDGYGAAALNLENHFAHVMFSFRLNFYVNYGILTETIQLRENPPAGKGSTYENLRTDY